MTQEEHIYRIKEDLKSFLSDGITQYQFLAALDMRTCPICGHLDGKVFDIGSATIGVNCPPMHEKCRCTVIAYTSQNKSRIPTRIARDPITHKNYKVPYTTTWTDWKEQY